MNSEVLQALVFGAVLAAGLGLITMAGTLSRAWQRRRGRSAGDEDPLGGVERVRPPRLVHARRLTPIMTVQIAAAVLGAVAGWVATGLFGMVVLLGGMGALLPPFMAAPAQRRRHTRRALAWSQWSRQIAELARAGSGLAESLSSTVEHAPSEIADTVERAAATARLQGLEKALEQLAEAGQVWEPEVAAGLRMAATSGGAVAKPLLDLSGRITDAVALHRSKTEAVVQLWAQTVALWGTATAVVALMYRNNPSYFDPYRDETGQLVLVGISGLLLLSTAFLVYHSVVRDENSVLIAPRRRNRARPPL